MDAILAETLKQGLGYTGFAILLIWVMRKQDARDIKTDLRESNYQKLINDLSEKFNIVEVIKNQVDEIRDDLKLRK